MHARRHYDHVPNLDVCTIINRQGDPCGQPSAQAAPFPICDAHLVRAYRFMRGLLGGLADDPVTMTKLILENIEAKRARERYALVGRTLVVYYVQIGEHIKIGHTWSLHQRLAAYPPYRRLLAVEEVDSVTVETERHAQFAHLLAVGKEWFRPGPDLIEHINQLRREAGSSPIDLAA